MLRRVCVTGADEFVLQRLELLLGAELVGLLSTRWDWSADGMVEGEVVGYTMSSLFRRALICVSVGDPSALAGSK